VKKTILIPDRLTSPADVERDVFGPYAEILTPCAQHVSDIGDEVWVNADAIY